MTAPDPAVGRAVATADVLVVGGGLHGCSAALHCARNGLSVIVVEKDTVGRHASGVNAGGVRRLGRAIAEIPLSLAAMEIWHRIADLVDDDCGFRPAPQIKVAETDTQMQALADRAAMLRDLGYAHETVLDRDELFRLLPAVSQHCVGGLASLGDGFADPYRTTAAFRRKAERLGVRVLEGCAALGVEVRQGGFRLRTAGGPLDGGILVNCGGAWAGAIAAQLGEPVPVEPIAPMMLVTSRLPPFCRAVVGAAGRPLSFKQMDNGTVVIGGGRRGTIDAGGNATRLRLGELAKTARTASEIFPIVGRAEIVRGWAGIEGRMPDDLPVIGPSSTTDGAYHAFGFSAHGFQLGPVVGSALADLIVGRRPDLPLAPFRIGRFSASIASTAPGGAPPPTDRCV